MGASPHGLPRGARSMAGPMRARGSGQPLPATAIGVERARTAVSAGYRVRAHVAFPASVRPASNASLERIKRMSHRYLADITLGAGGARLRPSHGLFCNIFLSQKSLSLCENRPDAAARHPAHPLSVRPAGTGE